MQLEEAVLGPVQEVEALGNKKAPAMGSSCGQVVVHVNMVELAREMEVALRVLHRVVGCDGQVVVGTQQAGVHVVGRGQPG